MSKDYIDCTLSGGSMRESKVVAYATAGCS